jgi:hypothetical protein
MSGIEGQLLRMEKALSDARTAENRAIADRDRLIQALEQHHRHYIVEDACPVCAEPTGPNAPRVVRKMPIIPLELETTEEQG